MSHSYDPLGHRAVHPRRTVARPASVMATAILFHALLGPFVGVAGAQPRTRALQPRAVGDFQSVNPTVAFQHKSPSTAASVTFQYTASSPSTVGLGLRLHFDSSKLTYGSVTDIFGPDTPGSVFFAMGPSDVMNDGGNQDADSATDKVILLAWADTESGFPGTLPQNLFTVNFTTAPGFSANTNVNVTATATAAGFGFSSTPATIAPPGAPTPTPTPTPIATVTPTPTATPPADPAVLDIDDDTEVKAFSDGLLVLRYLIGFRQANLTNGVVDTVNCGDRCTWETIQPYIASILVQLDIDDDGETKAFSDGLLVLRYLLGFRNTNLTNGVVDTVNCGDRCTWETIQPYIEGLRQ